MLFAKFWIIFAITIKPLRSTTEFSFGISIPIVSGATTAGDMKLCNTILQVKIKFNDDLGLTAKK